MESEIWNQYILSTSFFKLKIEKTKLGKNICLKGTKNRLLRKCLKSFAPSEKDTETQHSESREKKREKYSGEKDSCSRERTLEGSQSYICRTVGGCQRAWTNVPAGFPLSKTLLPKLSVWESDTLNVKLPQQLPDYSILPVAISYPCYGCQHYLIIRFRSIWNPLN